MLSETIWFSRKVPDAKHVLRTFTFHFAKHTFRKLAVWKIQKRF